ncbi:hypothetical protein LR48_Vigan312s000800 [Vigna angularis]|uniref:Uncharacterized protein n=1 Tax=Phaseolus angularis TaxID=3914 RepID=A0A0L9T828_PHAAN|nr:hypothetical protein LR48_Vigan312s000800 [Vigna angularis]
MPRQYAIGRNSLDLDLPKIRPKPKIVPLSGKCVSWFFALNGLFTPQRIQREFLSAAQRARPHIEEGRSCVGTAGGPSPFEYFGLIGLTSGGS